MMAKLLLAEDDLTMMGLLRTLFQLEGYQVVLFEGISSDDLLKLLQKEKPDGMLLDVNLRQFSGLEIIRRIRQNPEFNQLPVIMTSGTDWRAQCLEAGANIFILKPFNPDELLKSVKELLTN
jgi:DNA-binding response OmpR family regulator